MTYSIEEIVSGFMASFRKRGMKDPIQSILDVGQKLGIEIDKDSFTVSDTAVALGLPRDGTIGEFADFIKYNTDDL